MLQAAYASHNLLESNKDFFIILNLIPIVGKEVTLLFFNTIAFPDSAKCIYLVFLIRQNSVNFRRVFFIEYGCGTKYRISDSVFSCSSRQGLVTCC